MVINTNIAALTSANNLNNSTSMLNQSLARLSSGSQIVTAADNPAGLAESISLTSLTTQVGAANNAVSNASSFAQTQDGYLQQVGSALQQMSQLSIEAQDGTQSTAERDDDQQEFAALASFINQAASQTFNGVSLFSTAALVVNTDGNGGTRDIQHDGHQPWRNCLLPLATTGSNDISTTTGAATA